MISPKSRILPSATEWFVITVIIAALFAVVYPAMQNVRNPKGPYGEIIPSLAPDEANRVIHPTGISIVAPVNWDQIRDRGSDVRFLSIAARGAPGRRLKSWITIQECSEPGSQVVATYSKVIFQGNTAYEAMAIDRESTFDDEGRSTWQLYWQLQHKWWNITFCIADEVTVLPEQVRLYINTTNVPL